ncbi:MAG: hypothetical protein ACI391_00730 [Muribaculaceae bacterium]
MNVLLIILLIVFLLFYFGPWIAKHLLFWQLRKMQKRTFDAFNQASNRQQQQQQQPRRSKYDNAVGQDAQFEEITNEDSTNPTSPSCSYTPSPKVSDAKWEEIN